MAKRFRPVVYTLDGLLAARLPVRPKVLSYAPDSTPIITAGNIVELYAPRGVGKSMFALGLSLSLASGKPWLCWAPHRKFRVLYVDGEMPGEVVRDRARSMIGSMGIAHCSRLTLLGRDWQDDSMPRLDTEEGERALEPFLLNADWDDQDDRDLEHIPEPAQLTRWAAEVVVLDNASCLFDPEAEEKGSAWQPAQQLLLSLRARGITVLLVCHAGAGADSGHSRGSTKREDVIDTAISLTHPKGYRPEQGTKFRVAFQKNRTFYGDAAAPLIVSFSDEAGWTWAPARRPGAVSLTGGEQREVDLREKVIDYIRTYPDCSPTRVEERVVGDTNAIRAMLKLLLETDVLEKVAKGASGTLRLKRPKL